MATCVKRDTSLDFISGILIIHMILGHTMGFPFIKTNYILHSLFFFYMPWFFYKSGMFFKVDTDLKFFAKKKYERLIKPFLFFSVVGEVFFILDSILMGIPLTDVRYYLTSVRTVPYIGHFVGNPPCWFLLALFFVVVGYNIFLHKINKLLLSGALFILLLLNHHYNPFPIFSVTHTVCGCLFFLMGLLLKEYQYNKFVFFIALIGLCFAIPYNVFVFMVSDLCDHGNYILWYPFSLCAIIVINNVAKYIPSDIAISKFFVWVGQNSMLLLVIHWPILIALKIAFLNTGIVNEAWQFVVISVIAIAILTPLLKHLISKIKFIKI
ncbi:MAG: acyltransferase family protein [Paludibacteraceae bacterium]|nr:acyltransferase family protein [Paludibacteraceae bacterium]